MANPSYTSGGTKNLTPKIDGVEEKSEGCLDPIPHPTKDEVKVNPGLPTLLTQPLVGCAELIKPLPNLCVNLPREATSTQSAISSKRLCVSEGYYSSEEPTKKKVKGDLLVVVPWSKHDGKGDDTVVERDAVKKHSKSDGAFSQETRKLPCIRAD